MDAPGKVTALPVDFAGVGSGERLLTWAQQDHWKGILEAGQAATMGAAHAMPPGSSIAEVADILRFIMSRHQALRTRLRFEADGSPWQVCSAAGAATLLIVDAGAAEPDEVAQAWTARLREQPFDYENDWPVRMAAITAAGRITHVVTVYLHLAIDAGGLAALLADLAARDPATGAPAGPVTALEPLELARRQASLAALRKSSASLRHLEHVLRTVHPATFGTPRRPGPAEYRAIRYRSPATAIALDRIVAEQQVTGATAMLAMFAVGLARRLQQQTVWAMLLVSNRFRPGFADSVSLLTQSSPCLIDVADISLGAAIVRVQSSLLQTYKSAYYSNRQRDVLIAQLNRERNQQVQIGCYYNDRREDRPPGPLATGDQVRQALADSSWVEDRQPALPRMTLFVNVDESPGAIDFPISFDARYFEVDEVVALARAVEAAAVETALTPDAPTQLTDRVGQPV